MPGRLEGKVAIITGADSGIRLAAVKKFLEEGRRGVTDQSLCVTCHKRYIKGGGDQGPLQSRHRQVRKARYYMLECRYHAHGVQSWLDMDVGWLDAMCNVNVKGTWLGVKHSVRAMLASPSKGKNCAIVLTSSIVSLHSGPGFSLYNASKWAIRGLGNTTAQEFVKFGMRVNTIQPGVTKTQMYQEGPKENRAFVEGKNIFKRAAEPEEIANVMAFLASDEASYVSGSTVAVHAGQTCT
ncbi:NAD(P)-binding protein [Neolentinus lepideus HHB14362 ss-1]|uniref:NAD(P)-binding protein n=1 Tax=Neolentinus lepideus HHB14362 ss-1 TaxID=1314782 RepID=A0A165TSU3_9AGAM|nr:NAD(P)-binding protein [Neolentinus lepideus HHB14362 ss-1]